MSEIKTGNARFHALIQFDLHSFDQNILSFENVLFKLNHKKRSDQKLDFFTISLSLFINSSFYMPESKS